MAYQIIALLFFTFSVVKGFRKGFLKQIPMFIGFCFGVVCARLFALPAEDLLSEYFPSIGNKPEGNYVYSILSRGMIYILAYEVFSFCTGFLKFFFGRKESGMPGSLGGSLFCAVRYILMLSVVYNIILCCTMDSTLLRFAKSDDGNIVESVMLVAPAILGGESVEDLAHALQLEEARTIS